MEKKITKAIFLLFVCASVSSIEAQPISGEKLVHTYSIVARDKVTGEMAVGVQSHYFAVGNIVSWGKSGVGVVATQSFVNPAYGPDGVRLMEEGKSATEALQVLLSGDKNNGGRQVALLDANGKVAAYTGEKSIPSASHIVGDNYSVQANLMANDRVVPAMAKAFEDNGHLPLAERVLKALFAAQEAGGDIRGQQSAVLIVVNAKPVESSQDKKIDIRVDDHKQPLIELQRLLNLHHANEHLAKGDEALDKGDMELALKEYGAAEVLDPDNIEMKYWKAVMLANNKRAPEALVIFKKVFKSDENYRELTKRLSKSGLLTVPDADLKRILEL